MLAIILGGLAAVGIGYARDALDRRRAAVDPQFEVLVAVAKETRGDLGRILWRVRGAFARRGAKSA